MGRHGELADQDQHLADEDEAFARRLKKGDEPPPNPPKR
jgi:hypothetical protein